MVIRALVLLASGLIRGVLRPAATGALHLDSKMQMLLMWIWKIITKGK